MQKYQQEKLNCQEKYIQAKEDGLAFIDRNQSALYFAIANIKV